MYMNITNKLIEGIKEYFKNTNGKVAVIGISGGKDSSVAAGLCVKALGKENVLGVLMPNGTQDDINDSYKLCEFLDIDYLDINIHNACYAIESEIDYLVRVKSKPVTNKFNQVSKRAEINLQPRIRMATLYAVAQSIDGGRVINTTNKSEAFVGYGTLWGDTVGDFAPLADLLVSDVIIIGKDLGLPEQLIYKTPSDGLSGKSDEENLGVTYDDITNYIRCNGVYKYDELNGQFSKTKNFGKIRELHKKSEFKRNMINIPKIKL